MNRVMTVSQLASYLKGVFEDEELLHDVTLTGEVTDVSYSDRHTFLTVADGAYSIRCMHFSSRDNIEKGARVALVGSVGFYDKRSSVSFIYKDFRLDGAGDKNAKLAEAKQKLYELGYFENRPRLPKYIVSVAVITSADGAAIRDFLRVVHDENPFVTVKVFPAKVQGEGAAAIMTDAVKKLQSYKTDAIVLCRGGGSEEDLDSFNDYTLAEAVANSKIPVISAVGHEINFSLCDYCAGTRAGTPSIAGQIVNAHASRLTQDIAEAVLAIKNGVAARYRRDVMRVSTRGKAAMYAISKRLDDGRNALSAQMRRGAYALGNKIDGEFNRLTSETTRLRTVMNARFTAERTRFDRLSALIAALDPHRIIKVGYAAVLRGRTNIKSVAGLNKNDEITLVFGDGTAIATVTGVKKGE